MQLTFAAAARIGWNKIGSLLHRSSTNPKVVKVRSQSGKASIDIGSPTPPHFPRWVGDAGFVVVFVFFFFLLFFLPFSSRGFYSGRAGTPLASFFLTRLSETYTSYTV